MKGVMCFGRKGKVSPRFIGPYKVEERVGKVAYKLALPSEISAVHNVFHVSKLQKYVLDTSHVLWIRLRFKKTYAMRRDWYKYWTGRKGPCGVRKYL